MEQIKGWFAYKGLTTLQHEDIPSKFRQLFMSVKPKQILEIGTFNGGFTVLLRDLLDELNLNSCPIRSYDIVNVGEYVKNYVEENQLNIEFRTKNLFTPNYDSLLEVDEVADFINREGTTLVICDGGYKKNEFNAISKFLKTGDIIMAHDYCKNSNHFEEYIKDKIWNWCEIEDRDVENTCIEYNLHPFMQEEFEKVVWLCRRKL